MDLMALIPFASWSRTRAASLCDELPHADTLPRSVPRVELVAADNIVGTTRRVAAARRVRATVNAIAIELRLIGCSDVAGPAASRCA